MIELLIEDSRGNIVTHQLGEGRHTLGKSPDSDLVLMDPYVSRYHADLLVTRTGMFIIDMDSTNGIWSQGKRIKKILKINHGEVFTLGRMKLQTRIPRFKLYVREGRKPIKMPLEKEDDKLSPQDIDKALLLDVPEIIA